MTIVDALQEVTVYKINKQLKANCYVEVETKVEGVAAMGEPVVVLAMELIDFQTTSRRKVFKGHSWAFIGLDGNDFEVMISTPLIIVNCIHMYDLLLDEITNG